jgi:hypothetical protein
MEAITYFAKPGMALQYLAKMRWPNGPHCPRQGCGEMNPIFLETRGIWKCRGCRKQFSVKVGTIMEDSPLSVEKWLAAIWMIANCKNGISSYEIHRALGITQKSAWFVLHRVRLAMEIGSFEKTMLGPVEADESFIGGKVKNMSKAKRAERAKGRGGIGSTRKAIVQEGHRSGDFRSQREADPRQGRAGHEGRELTAGDLRQREAGREGIHGFLGLLRSTSGALRPRLGESLL